MRFDRRYPWMKYSIQKKGTIDWMCPTVQHFDKKKSSNKSLCIKANLDRQTDGQKYYHLPCYSFPFKKLPFHTLPTIQEDAFGIRSMYNC